jgi:hypothetical protein
MKRASPAPELSCSKESSSATYIAVKSAFKTAFKQRSNSVQTALYGMKAAYPPTGIDVTQGG